MTRPALRITAQQPRCFTTNGKASPSIHQRNTQSSPINGAQRTASSTTYIPTYCSISILSPLPSLTCNQPTIPPSAKFSAYHLIAGILTQRATGRCGLRQHVPLKQDDYSSMRLATGLMRPLRVWRSRIFMIRLIWVGIL